MKIIFILLLLISLLNTCRVKSKDVVLDGIVYALLKADLFGDKVVDKVTSNEKILLSDTLIESNYTIHDSAILIKDNSELKEGEHEYLQIEKLDFDTTICDIWFLLPKSRISYRVILVKEKNGERRDKYADREQY